MNNPPMLPSVGAAVYGTITVGTLLAAEGGGSETYPETIGAVSVAIVLVWLAGSYADFTESRLQLRQGFTLRGFAAGLAHEVMIIVAAAPPLATLLICWASEVSLTLAVTAAIWTSVAMVVIVELVVGLRANLTRRQLAAHTALGALFGLLIIALKLVLHH
jgi:hypothetical protein